MKWLKYTLYILLLVPTVVFGQQNPAPIYPTPGSPAEAQSKQEIANETGSQTPLFRVNVYARTAQAVNYRNRGGSTVVELRGTELMPDITGRAKVDGKAGRLVIDAELRNMKAPSSIGPEYLTYVLWAVTPEGRAVNLGEVLPDGSGKDKLTVTTDLQAFGLIVTAEPYFAVTHPSDKVVAQNVIPSNVKGFPEAIDSKFDVLEGREYTIDVPADQLPSAQADPNVPLDLLEARNAVAIARAARAQQYDSGGLMKAEDMLQRAEDYYQRKQGRTPIGTAARGATQMAEDARVLSLRKQEAEREDAARRASAEAQAKAQADAEAARHNAEQAQAQADEDARQRAAAEAAAQQAQSQAQQAQSQAQQAEREKQQALQEKEQMRARLMAQLNQVLQTRDTARGLIVSMPDVLFGFDKYSLKPEARERLAKISGIILAYPDLKLQIEGHTDSIGSDEYNQQLSEKRAETVKGYLISNGVAPDNVSAEGLGKADPVADNSTAAGRKLNRRVDMVVSGEAIGTQIGTPSITLEPEPSGPPSR